MFTGIIEATGVIEEKIDFTKSLAHLVYSGFYFALNGDIGCHRQPAAALRFDERHGFIEPVFAASETGDLAVMAGEFEG